MDPLIFHSFPSGTSPNTLALAFIPSIPFSPPIWAIGRLVREDLPGIISPMGVARILKGGLNLPGKDFSCVADIHGQFQRFVPVPRRPRPHARSGLSSYSYPPMTSGLFYNRARLHFKWAPTTYDKTCNKPKTWITQCHDIHDIHEKMAANSSQIKTKSQIRYIPIIEKKLLEKI
jgi:hypothetical protein